MKDRKGHYHNIPGSRKQYVGYYPLWQLLYSIIPYIRMKFYQHGLGFQNLYNIPQSVEVPWMTYQQFGNLIGNITDMLIAEENWQPMINAIWENRAVEDYETTSSTVKTNFMRKWHHNRSGKPISLDEMMESEDGNVYDGYAVQATGIYGLIAQISEDRDLIYNVTPVNLKRLLNKFFVMKDLILNLHNQQEMVDEILLPLKQA